jgi:hypothetical protein
MARFSDPENPVWWVFEPRDAAFGHLCRGGACRGGARLVLAAVPANLIDQRFQKDFEVQQDRPPIDVLAIQPHYFLEIRNRGIALQLPKARDPRLHAEPPSMMRSVTRDLGLGRRARAYEAHVAAEHVPELRQLVDMSAPQGRPKWCDSRIVADLEHVPLHFIFVEQPGQTLFRVDAHRSKFVQSEQAAVAANPRLLEQDTATRFAVYPQRAQKIGYAAYQQPNEPANYVDKPLNAEE